MKKDKAWIWATTRIVLAVVLLFLIFRYSIQFTDTVQLSDGTVVSGTIVKYPDADVTIEVKGRKTAYPLTAIMRENGEYKIGTDSIETTKGRVIVGTIVERPDLSVAIKSGSQSEPVVYQLNQVAVSNKGVPKIEQGLISILKRMTAESYIIGLLLLSIVPIIAAVRWRMLLEAQDIKIGFGLSLELTLIGLFFNNFMPGLTGGDIIKAYYAAKLTSERKTHAVVTVFLDRIIGMIALGLVAGVAICIGLFTTGTADRGPFKQAHWFVGAFIVVSIIGALVFYSRRLRAVSKKTVQMMPGYGKVRSMGVVHRIIAMLVKVDSAVFLYRSKKMVLVNTTLISFVAHSAAILSIYFFGRALSINQASVVQYFVVVPVSFIVSSVPVTPAGWGVGEYVFKIFFGAVGIPGTAAITMSVIYRFTSALWTLPGGVILMFQRERATVEEAEAEMGGGLLGSEDAGQDS
jgi:glycosyltransferase 2 family protein